MFETILSSLVPAAIDMIRGNRQDNRQDDANNANVALQREFAQHGVRWRVEDAQAAGLHPLFALGASGAQFSPSITVGADNMGAAMSRAGQSFSRAVQAQETQAQRDMVQLQLDAARQRIATDFAQEQSIWSQMALREQAAMGAKPWPDDVVVNAYKSPGNAESHQLFQDAVKLSPDELTSRSSVYPEQTAGRGHPTWREFNMGGFNILLPATGQGGVPEEIDVAMLPFILAANRKRYGERWSGDALRYVVWAKSPDDYDNRRGPSVKGLIRY